MQALHDTDIGARLRVAREGAGLTPAAAAEAIGVARTTLVALEKGQRRPRIGEIQELARRYGTSANALLRREAAHVDLTPRFRRLGTADSGAAEAARLLTDLVRAEVELENLLGITRARDITDDQARQVLGDFRLKDTDTLDAEHPVPLRLIPLAAEAHRRELLSEGQLARLLRLDRIELRKVLDDADIDGSGPDGAPKLP